MDESKVWWQSLTLWGAIITVLAAVAGIFGFTIDIQTQKEIVEYIMVGGSAVGGLMAAYGRIRASKIIVKTIK